MPRVLALVWELVGSDLADGIKKATLLHFDQVLGLELDQWQPEAEEAVPAEIRALAEQRQRAREEKDWEQADEIRDKIIAAGYEIIDAPEGPKLSRSIPSHILQMVEERTAARAAKDWAKADEMRDKITAAGYEVIDAAEGPQIQPIP